MINIEFITTTKHGVMTSNTQKMKYTEMYWELYKEELSLEQLNDTTYVYRGNKMDIYFYIK